MMSKLQWSLVLCLFWVYLLLGAFIFYTAESVEESRRQKADLEERQIIGEMMYKHFRGDNRSMQNFLNRLNDYCGKPISFDMDEVLLKSKWDFYHSLFFVITVVSTIGYGNLAPTTMFTRIFMIFYGLIGIPMNGIVMVTMGEYFAKSFKKLYRRWKSTKIEESYAKFAKFGLIGQIILYAVPGLTFFIFLPATVISVFEQWQYDVAVYYAFVTLTTIGFGDYVAGVENVNDFSPVVVGLYQFFLLVWVTGGIGYVVMIINFITQGMRSRKLQKMEKALAENIRKTPQKIRNELRALLQEFLFVRVKPVYKGEFDYVPHQIERTQSCPDLTIYRNLNSPTMARKRAMSECYKYNVMLKTSSETELEKIDKERTFRPSDAFMQQKDIILKFFDALSAAAEKPKDEKRGIDCFSDEEILKSENVILQRRRAISDIRPPLTYQNFNEKESVTWYGNDASTALKEFRKQRALSMPYVEKIEKQTIFKKIKNKLRFKDDKEPDVEKQNLEVHDLQRPSVTVPPFERKSSNSSLCQDSILEHTSIADIIRALTNISRIDVSEEQSQGKTAASTPSQLSPKQRRKSILPCSRRTSLIPTINPSPTIRRFSLRPVTESELASPHSTFVAETRNSFKEWNPGRKFSIKPTPNVINSTVTSPVRAQVNKKKRTASTSDNK